MRSQRRCCLCFFLRGDQNERKGQIAHLNRNPADSHFENLVFLCLDHHDEYDSKPSQSKGLQVEEVRRHRDNLYASLGKIPSKEEIETIEGFVEIKELSENTDYEVARLRFFNELACTSKPWRFPLWLIANQSEMFAYKASSDGICLIERIDLPDERIVIACIQLAGNPGQSITNAVELICFQVCERFEIPPDKLVWLEHYDDYGEAEWHRVEFSSIPPMGWFTCPSWNPMTPEMWADLKLRPKKLLSKERGRYGSKLTKLFHWPDDPIL